MGRGGHRHGYNWDIPDKDKSTVDVPTEIKEEVVKAAREIWEKRKEQKKQENKRDG